MSAFEDAISGDEASIDPPAPRPPPEPDPKTGEPEPAVVWHDPAAEEVQVASALPGVPDEHPDKSTPSGMGVQDSKSGKSGRKHWRRLFGLRRS